MTVSGYSSYAKRSLIAQKGKQLWVKVSAVVQSTSAVLLLSGLYAAVQSSSVVLLRNGLYGMVQSASVVLLLSGTGTT